MSFNREKTQMHDTFLGETGRKFSSTQQKMPFSFTKHRKGEPTNIFSRKEARQAVIKPRRLDGAMFDEAKELDEELFGKKVQLGEKTLGSLGSLSDSIASKNSVGMDALKSYMETEFKGAKKQRVQLGRHVGQAMSRILGNIEDLESKEVEKDLKTIKEAVDKINVPREWQKSFNQRFISGKSLHNDPNLMSLVAIYLVSHPNKPNMSKAIFNTKTNRSASILALQNLHNDHYIDLEKREIIDDNEMQHRAP